MPDETNNNGQDSERKGSSENETGRIDFQNNNTSDSEAEAITQGKNITRRLFLRVLAALGLLSVTDKIGGGFLSTPILDHVFGSDVHSEDVNSHQTKSLEKESQDISSKIDKIAQDIAQKIESERPDLSSREGILHVIDYTGCYLFYLGIKDLLPDGCGHINSARYGALMALTSLKYLLSNDEERQHLEHETVASMNAFYIINGTIVLAEGMDMDLNQAYQEMLEGKIPGKKDQIALINMLASVTSPLATTVGSASMIKNLSNELVKTGEKDEKGKDIKDTNMMAMFESHVSNLAGYLLFGDPPFIAICEKYGFAEGMLWQIKNMWPLALYSLFSSTYKLNLCLIEREGLQRPEAWAKAFENTVSGIKNNIPVLVNILIGSFANAWRYFMGVDLSEQDIRGIRFQIGEILSKKIGNLATLPYSEEFGKTADEKEQDMLGYLSEIGAEWDLFQGLQQELDRLEKDEKSENASEKSFRDRLNRAIFEKRYDEVIRLGQENGIPLIELFVMNLKDFEKARQKGYNFSQDGVEMPRDWKLFFHNFQFYKVYDRATDVERIKHAVGHNMGDVIDVFPFQAGCVPFLTTAFKDVVWGLEKAGLPKTMQEVMMFFMIMGFSMVADNYVACKVGLELFPDNPQIPLIAAIQGGSMTAIGNMANIAQFSLDDFPLAKSWAMKNWHMDNIAIGLAWSQAIKALKNLGIGYFESPEVKNSSDNHAKSETGSLLKFTQTDGSEKITRRDFLHGNKKKAA